MCIFQREEISTNNILSFSRSHFFSIFYFLGLLKFSWCIKDMLNVLFKSHFYFFVLWRSSSTWENKYSIWLRTLETSLDHVLLSPSIFLCVKFSTEQLSNCSSSADIAEGRRYMWKINMRIKSSLSCVHIAVLERNAIGAITKGFTFTSLASLRYFSVWICVTLYKLVTEDFGNCPYQVFSHRNQRNTPMLRNLPISLQLVRKPKAPYFFNT